MTVKPIVLLLSSINKARGARLDPCGRAAAPPTPMRDLPPRASILRFLFLLSRSLAHLISVDRENKSPSSVPSLARLLGCPAGGEPLRLHGEEGRVVCCVG